MEKSDKREVMKELQEFRREVHETKDVKALAEIKERVGKLKEKYSIDDSGDIFVKSILKSIDRRIERFSGKK